MHRLLFSLLCVLTVLGSLRAECYFDTESIWFYQGKPYDDTNFEGRYWGDPLEYWYQTTSGYTFIPKLDAYGVNFFYYATLDGSGEFMATDSIVGVNGAPSSSYNLDRSSARKTVIDSLRLLAYPNNSIAIDSTRARMARAASLDEPVVFQIGILLVHFSNTDYEEFWVDNELIEAWPGEPFSVVDDQFNLLEHQFVHPNIV